MKIGSWLMRRFDVDYALIGDLAEQRHARSSIWLTRQVFRAIGASTVAALRRRPGIALLALTAGWTFLFLFSQVSPAMRGAVLWPALAFAFFAAGWIVAKIASSLPMPVVTAFAMSVGVTTATAVLLDGPLNTDIRIWLTVPLFLTVAPPMMIVAGGLFAASSRLDRSR
jgi:hypothetical protein